MRKSYEHIIPIIEQTVCGVENVPEKDFVDPYMKGMINEEMVAKSKRRSVVCELVAISNTKYDKRELRLISPRGRVVRVNEIHELMTTDEQDAGPGKTVNSVAVLGFFEVKIGGVVSVGERVLSKNGVIGEVAGFDESHMPNHMNLLVKADKMLTGIEMGMELGQKTLIVS